MRFTLATAAALLGAAVLVSPAFAGDPTPPPGPVSGTMKTLTEVEPRIAINDVNTPGDADAQFVIISPGSYYLTKNILGVSGKHGIQIISGDVTLDLNGFELRGVTGSLNGVHLTPFVKGVTVRNGSVRGWGQNGLYLKTDCGVVEDLRISDSNRWGIDVSSAFGGRISNCTLINNGGEELQNGGGINSGQAFVIEGCALYDNIGYGMYVSAYSIVSGCTVVDTIGRVDISQDGSGIYIVSSYCLVESSGSSSNAGYGIYLGSTTSLARGCVAGGNTLGNITFSGSSQAIDCVAP